MKPAAEGWTYIGLLTHQHKQAGLFVSQDDDFIWLCRAVNGAGEILAVFSYETATIREVREEAEKYVNGVAGPSGGSAQPHGIGGVSPGFNAIGVACPQCHVGAGKQCRQPNGKQRVLGTHLRRFDELQRVGGAIR
ncbi:hypothetical protein LCGC14_1212070 [marine sediment metagenome]|uniref:DNA-binding phage zinc finger domain-containing protein n=1 Tax=marine sediment metagenome TaxID=412755 RepID=A0A0F9M138_9ZZZZ